MARKLTPKQKRFVEEYMIDLNATQAAIRAGYKHMDNGRQLLTKTHVLDAIRAAQAKQSARTEITADRVVKELARIAFVDTRQVFTWGPNGVTLRDSSELTDDEAAIVSEVSETTTESGGTIKAKRFDKLKALELLGKHLGMFVEKKEISGPDGGAINVNQHSEADLTKLTDEEFETLAAISAKARGDAMPPAL
jgi:phage terminase small subunit